MKFRVGDIVRHVNGVKEFVVYTTDRIQCVYGLKEEGSPVVHYYAASHVDSMYRHVYPLDESSVLRNYQKLAALAVGYGAKPDASLDNFVNKIKFVPGRGWVHSDGESMVSKCSAILDTPSVHAAESVAAKNCPSIVSPASDVAVILRGLPAGYYLKSFRKAEPGDLILNTRGVVVPAKITQNGMTLYRSIVGKVSSLNVLNPNPIPGVPDGWTVISYRVPSDGEKYLTTVSGSDEVVTADRAVNFKRLVVKPTPRLTTCDGTLPGIPKGYRLVGFGAVNEKQFYIDTVGNLKSGPAKHRLILEPLVDGPVKQPEVATEYEIECWGATVWAHIGSYVFPDGANVNYTGRTRKVVVQ